MATPTGAPPGGGWGEAGNISETVYVRPKDFSKIPVVELIIACSCFLIMFCGICLFRRRLKKMTKTAEQAHAPKPKAAKEGERNTPIPTPPDTPGRTPSPGRTPTGGSRGQIAAPMQFRPGRHPPAAPARESPLRTGSQRRGHMSSGRRSPQRGGRQVSQKVRSPMSTSHSTYFAPDALSARSGTAVLSTTDDRSSGSGGSQRTGEPGDSRNAYPGRLQLGSRTPAEQRDDGDWDPQRVRRVTIPRADGAAVGFRCRARGLAVVGVEEGSPADAAGVRVGWRVYSVGGAVVRTVAEMRGALSHAPPGALDVELLPPEEWADGGGHETGVDPSLPGPGVQPGTPGRGGAPGGWVPLGLPTIGSTTTGGTSAGDTLGRAGGNPNTSPLRRQALLDRTSPPKRIRAGTVHADARGRDVSPRGRRGAGLAQSVRGAGPEDTDDAAPVRAGRSRRQVRVQGPSDTLDGTHGVSGGRPDASFQSGSMRSMHSGSASMGSMGSMSSMKSDRSMRRANSPYNAHQTEPQGALARPGSPAGRPRRGRRVDGGGRGAQRSATDSAYVPGY